MERVMKNMACKLVAVFVAVACVITSINLTEIKSEAAGEVKKITTMECSVWSKPSTKPEYRVKKIPAGYTVSVYPTPVKSKDGDGKTFYKTTKGCYILCKCFDGTGAGNVPTGGNVVKETYKTPYSTANVTLVPGTAYGKSAKYFFADYKGVPSYVAITFYVNSKGGTAKLKYERNPIVLPAGMPIYVWGYTTDGYYICGKNPRLIGMEYCDDEFALVAMGQLTESVPAKLADPNNFVNKNSKKDPNTESYGQYTFAYDFTPAKYYCSYLQQAGYNAYMIGGQKYAGGGEQFWATDVKKLSNSQPSGEYVFMKYDGLGYDGTLNRLKVCLDESLVMEPDAESVVLTVPINEFTPAQFKSLRKEVYNYAVSKYGNRVKIGADRLWGIEWYSSPDTSQYSYREGVYYHFSIGLQK
ncbi:MAG: hypothetical protein KBS85_07600 [Lachnospiraceae bacterium]|nr:hypothetical protein [Candidatus Merdinaster equi]